MNIQETATFQAKAESEDWFSREATSNRFINSNECPFFPKNALRGNSKVTFIIPGQTDGYVILIQDHYLTIKCRMMLKNGNPIPNIPESPSRVPKIAPVNYVMHSLFSEVEVYIGSAKVNPSNNYYPYKAVIADLLSYSSVAKNTWMKQAGWYEDADYHFSNPNVAVGNAGFSDRRDLFLKDDKTAFGEHWVTFTGRLHLDLQSIDTGILPGNEVTIHCTFSNEKFRFISAETDWDNLENVVMELSDAVLFVPIAELNPQVWHNVKLKLQKEPSLMHFYRTQLNIRPIAAGSNQFVDDIQLNGNELPRRFLLIFLVNGQLNGDWKKNPYHFRRKFVSYKKDPEDPGKMIPDYDTEFFIKKVSVKIGGIDLSGYNEEANDREDPVGYKRFNQVYGWNNSMDQPDITPKKFLDNSFMSAWDLTSERKPSPDNVIPTIRRGHPMIHVEFSKPTSEELTVIVHGEFPSMMSINDERKILMSYFSTNKP